MNKKLITVVLTALLITPHVAKAEPVQPGTVAIIDTALDTSLPIFQGRIAQEVCILEWESCSNGKSFMEGPGAAGMPIAFMSKNGFQHGTQMAYVFASTNKDTKFVFIRIIGATKTGVRQTANEKTFAAALDWVFQNKSKYNIQAVSMSQGHHNLGKTANYCPSTTSTPVRIKALLDAGIPTFLPTGNTRDYSRIDWPACIDHSISIGATTTYEEIPNWSNMDINKADFYTLGVMDVLGPNSVKTREIGTSISAQVAAAKWMTLKTLKPTYTYDQLYAAFKKTSVTIYNQVKVPGQMMYLEGAMNE